MAPSAGLGEKECLVYQDERWSFAEADRDGASIADWILNFGSEPGGRVAIAMRNYPAWGLTYWACTSVGVAAVGMNAWWRGPELAYGVQDSDPKLIIADVERVDRLAEHAAEIGDCWIVGVRLPEARPNGMAWSELLSTGETVSPEVSFDRDDDACIVYTSRGIGHSSWLPAQRPSMDVMISPEGGAP